MPVATHLIQHADSGKQQHQLAAKLDEIAQHFYNVHAQAACVNHLLNLLKLNELLAPQAARYQPLQTNLTRQAARNVSDQIQRKK
jgi:hypothetical protein